MSQEGSGGWIGWDWNGGYLGLGVHRCATCLLCDVWVDEWFDMIQGMGGKDHY